MNLPPYATFPELKSEKLLLREARTEDIPSLMEALTYDGKAAQTPEEGMQIIRKIQRNYLDGESVNWVIEVPIAIGMETNQLIGFIGYYRGFENGIGEVGFVLKEAFRGKGFMSEALALAVNFGMNHMQLSQVRAFTKHDNEKSIAVLKRNGFIPEIEEGGQYLKFIYLNSSIVSPC